MSTRWIVALAIISMGLWGALLFTPAPIEYLGGDKITPDVLRVGQDFVVTRNFDVSRNTHVRIIRTIVHGDCKKQCDVFDISSGRSYLEKGEYRNRARFHTLPRRAAPGKYIFHTAIQWSDRIGYWHTTEAPPLQLEVIE